MADIVERLRDSDTTRRIGESYADVYDRRQADRDEAADEITRLRAENEKLRAALEDCLSWHDYSNDMHKPIEVRAAYMRARAALEEGRT